MRWIYLSLICSFTLQVPGNDVGSSVQVIWENHAYYNQTGIITRIGNQWINVDYDGDGIAETGGALSVNDLDTKWIYLTSNQASTNDYVVGDTVLLSGKTIQRGDIITSPGEYVVEDIKNENTSGIEVVKINGAWVSGSNMSYISLVSAPDDPDDSVDPVVPLERNLLDSYFVDHSYSYNNFNEQNLPAFWFVIEMNLRVVQQVYYITSTNSFEEHIYLDSMNITRLIHNHQPTTIFYPPGVVSNMDTNIVNGEWVYYNLPGIDLEPDPDFYMYLDKFRFEIVVSHPHGEEVLTLDDFAKLSNGTLQLKREGDFPQTYRTISSIEIGNNSSNDQTYALTNMNTTWTTIMLNSGIYWKTSKSLSRTDQAISNGYDISKYTPMFVDPFTPITVSNSPLTGVGDNCLRVYHTLNIAGQSLKYQKYRLRSTSAERL